MKVRLKGGFGTAERNYKKGDVIELDDDAAESFIEQDFAEPIGTLPKNDDGEALMRVRLKTSFGQGNGRVLKAGQVAALSETEALALIAADYADPVEDGSAVTDVVDALKRMGAGLVYRDETDADLIAAAKVAKLTLRKA